MSAGRVGPAFAAVLRASRDDLNAAYREAKRRLPDLEDDAFADFLLGCVDPMVERVARHAPERVTDFALVGYEVGLEVVGRRMQSAGRGLATIAETWRALFPILAPLLVEDPRRGLVSLANGLYTLAMTPGAAAARWAADLARLGPRCAGLDMLLALGQVLAWKCGMAQWRATALTIADGLPEDLALAAVGHPGGLAWARVRAAMVSDPWWEPATASEGTVEGASPGRLRIAAQAGAFRGFGGNFIEPPRVRLGPDGFVLRSGDATLLLTADVFGATLHRVPAEAYDAVGADSRPLPDGIKIDETTVRRRGESLVLPRLDAVSSVAADRATLAVTSARTHLVTLVALT